MSELNIVPGDILERLEKLRQYEEESNILNAKQLSQRELLNEEQQKKYEVEQIFTSANGSEENNELDTSELTLPAEAEKELQNTQKLSIKNTANISEISLDAFRFLKQNVDSVAKERNSENTIKHEYLKRGEGLTARFKINPEALRLNNIPKYKFSNVQKQKQKKKSADSTIKSLNKPKLIGELNLNKSKCISKLSTVKKNENNEIVEDNTAEAIDLMNNWIQQNVSNTKEPIETIEIKELLPIKWSTVLEPNNIQESNEYNSSTLNNQQQQSEIDDLNIFEMLEKKTENSSFSSDASIIHRFIASKKIEKNIVRPTDPLVSISDIPKNQVITPFPFDIDDRKILIDEVNSDCESYGLSSNNTSQSSYDNFDNNKLRVRFSENVQIYQEPDCLSSYELNETEITQTSTPNTKDSFEKFKIKLLEKFNERKTNNENEIIDQTIVDAQSLLLHQNKQQEEDLQIKSEQLKSRLCELEKEIEIFRNQNAILTKMKQTYELEKIQFDEEKIQLSEKLNDERIQLEVYLHDERMKLLNEKELFEKKVKELRRQQKQPTRKEREECQQLNDQILQLQKELTGKEQKHIAVQSRLRAQNRVIEKDLKDQLYENEQLQKLNKKLENENIRLRRQNNNKMLQEINKNIVKLTETNQTKTIQSNNEKSTKSHSAVTSAAASSSSSSSSKVIYNRSDKLAVTATVHSHQKETNKNNNNIANNVHHEQQISDNDSDKSYNTDDDPDNKNQIMSSYFVNNNKNDDNANVITKNVEIPTDKIVEPNLKREIVNLDGSRDIFYPNGNLKKISSDGMLQRMLYYNKDIKETNITEGTVKYYYADSKTWQTNYLDGLEILEFPR